MDIIRVMFWMDFSYSDGGKMSIISYSECFFFMLHLYHLINVYTSWPQIQIPVDRVVSK